jgi:hypothetical protein
MVAPVRKNKKARLTAAERHVSVTAQIIVSRMVSIRERLPCLVSVYTTLCGFGMPERFQFDYSQVRSGLLGLIGLLLTACASTAALTPA